MALRFSLNCVSTTTKRFLRYAKGSLTHAPTTDSDELDSEKREGKETSELGKWEAENKANVEDLLRDSALFLDLSAAGEDPWVTPPYPKSKNSPLEQSRHSYRPGVDPEQTSIILFPGQGSQHVGMGRGLLDYKNVPEMYERASSILGYDLLKLCIEGPQTELNKTVHSQVAVYVTSLAAVESLREKTPFAVENCISTAGLSSGEYAALVFAGCMNFETGLKLLHTRAQLMQKSSEEIQSGMMSVPLFADSQLRLAMQAAREYLISKGFNEPPVCCVANDLFTNFKVIAGHVEALDFVHKHRKEFRLGPMKRLYVSGAFHTELMRPAAREFWEHLKRIKFAPPAIHTHSNVDGKAYPADAMEIQKKLFRHMIKEVKWEQTMHILYSRNKGQHFPYTYVVGPGTHLKTILGRTNALATERSICVPT